MKKLAKFAGAAALISAVCVSAFGAAGCAHTHKWEWQRTETEHWQECNVKGCGETQNYGTHEDSVCDDCAEFKVIAFGFVDCIGVQGVDNAHADFANDANIWFSEKGKELGYIYDAVDTYKSGWGALNEENIANYDLIMLLNDKPGTEESKTVFKNYVDNGGACMAFHAAGFAMWSTPDTPPNDWEDWYSNEFLRSGVYGECPRDPAEPIKGIYYNTWNPTSEPMKIETHDHFSTENLDFDEFVSAPCEWYEWYHNLFEDNETTVLISMNPTPDNPAGDNPDKASEIWYHGHHAIAWANNSYNMIYMNWGHNLQSYNNGEEGKQSSTFSSEKQNQFMIEAMFGLTKK